jgi:hypothetical protein
MNPLYDKRIANKDSICFICSKFTNVVLRNDQDWFYCCDGHISDSSFCKPIYPTIEPPSSNHLENEQNEKEKLIEKPKEIVAQPIKRVQIHSSFLYLRQRKSTISAANISSISGRKIEFPSVPKSLP